MKEHNLLKEQYAVELLGYSLVVADDGYWKILDKDGKEVGYTKYNKLTNEYLTVIYGNNITYENTREISDKIFHYSFKNSIDVMMILDGLDKSIEIYIEGTHTFELSWNNKGFKIKLGEYKELDDNPDSYVRNHEHVITDFASYEDMGNFAMCDNYNNGVGEIEVMSIEKFIEKGNVVRLLSQFNCIMSQLFDKSLKEIIGEDDLEQSGLSLVFKTIEDIKKSAQKRYGVRK